MRTIAFVGGGFDLPVLASLNLPALILTTGAAIATFRFKIGMITVLLSCAFLGAVYAMMA